MANSVSASFKDVWAREQQEVFLKRNVAMQIADLSFNSSMKSGDVLVRTYRSTLASNSPGVYVRGTDITFDDITDTAETLTVNRNFALGFYFDDFDAIQSEYNTAMLYGKDKGIILSNQVDADVLGEWVNATSTVDDGSIAGTAGNGIALTTTNVLSVVTAVTRKLEKLNVMDNDKFGVVSPEFKEIIGQLYGAKFTALGDDVSQNGLFQEIYGYKLYSSNLTPGRATLTYDATALTDGDTVTIAGVTFTFKTTLGTTAGNVLIGADSDASMTNLAALINAPQTTTAEWVALTGENLKFVQTKWAAAATTAGTGGTVLVTVKGIGTLTVSETLTPAADVWTTTLQKQLLCFGVKGNPVLVIQKSPSVEEKENPNRLGKNILNGCLYGVKTFVDNAKQMVKVEIKSSAY